MPFPLGIRPSEKVTRILTRARFQPFKFSARTHAQDRHGSTGVGGKVHHPAEIKKGTGKGRHRPLPHKKSHSRRYQGPAGEERTIARPAMRRANLSHLIAVDQAVAPSIPRSSPCACEKAASHVTKKETDICLWLHNASSPLRQSLGQAMALPFAPLTWIRRLGCFAVRFSAVQSHAHKSPCQVSKPASERDERPSPSDHVDPEKTGFCFGWHWSLQIVEKMRPDSRALPTARSNSACSTSSTAPEPRAC